MHLILPDFVSVVLLTIYLVYLNMIRKILKVESDKVSISVPKNYIGKFMEIIAFTKDEEEDKEVLHHGIATFYALSLDTRGFKFNRDEANER